MDNQSFNSIPLTQNQNEMSIQMTAPQMHQMPQHHYNMQTATHPQMIQQQHHLLQQNLQQNQVMNNPQMMNNTQMMNNYQMMNSTQMIPQQYPIHQKQFQMYPSHPQQINNQPVSRYSQPLYCSNCQRIVPSLVEFEAGKGAWVSGLLIGLLGCWAGCCLIPCCNEDFQDAVHSCTICAQKLAKKQFLFD